MKTSVLKVSRAAFQIVNLVCRRLRSAGVMRLLPLLLLALPAGVQAQLAYTTNNGSITITGYSGPAGVVVIPGITNGFSVTSIGDSTFSNSYSLTGVTIPDSVTYIVNYAFYNCTTLTSVLMGNG